MATKFRLGDEVELAMVVPRGPVVELKMTPEGEFHYRVEWVDADGNAQSRWFREDELKAV